MLVCALMHIFGTRDRGCSAHPALPAPSRLRGANEFENLGQNMPRERKRMSEQVIPGWCATTRPGISRFSGAQLRTIVRCCASPRNDDAKSGVTFQFEESRLAPSLRVNLPVGIPQNILLHLAHRVARQ